MKVKYLKQLYNKHLAAISGATNKRDLECINHLQPESLDTFGWIDLQFSKQKTFREQSKSKFEGLKNQMLKKSLMQIVNNAFFQEDNSKAGRQSSIVKSMIIKNKLKDKLQAQKIKRDGCYLNVDRIQKQFNSSKFSRSKSGFISLKSHSPKANKSISSKEFSVNKDLSLSGFDQIQAYISSMGGPVIKRRNSESPKKQVYSSFVRKFTQIKQYGDS